VSWLLVAVGAGVGAGARHLLDGALTRGRFPTGILVVNLLGSLLAGVVAGAAPGPAVTDLVAVGLLGGFTTASTLAVDVLRLQRRGDARLAALDLGLSVGPGLVLAAVGVALGRALPG
jgi:CrcB protein